MMKLDPAVKMRRCFADLLHEQMQKNEEIWVITADLGYKMWDQIRSDFPTRFMNVGASEQAMMGIAVGLALEGKIPVVYSITPFLLYRPFETVRNYIHQEKIPVKMIASGRGQDYAHDGFSHWATEDKAILAILNNVQAYWPQDNSALIDLVEKMIHDPQPYYINLRK